MWTFESENSKKRSEHFLFREPHSHCHSASPVTPANIHPNLIFLELESLAALSRCPSRNLKLISCEIIFEVFQPVQKTYLKVTEGRTDRWMCRGSTTGLAPEESLFGIAARL